MKKVIVLMSIFGIGCVPSMKYPKTSSVSSCTKVFKSNGITYQINKVTIIKVDTLQNK